MAALPGWQTLTNFCDPTLAVDAAGVRCDFAALTELIRRGVTDLIIISTLLVVVACVVAGFKLVTAGIRGDSGALKDVKGMFMNILIGYAIILTAWIVVYTITSVLLKPSFSVLMK